MGSITLSQAIEVLNIHNILVYFGYYSINIFPYGKCYKNTNEHVVIVFQNTNYELKILDTYNFNLLDKESLFISLCLATTKIDSIKIATEILSMEEEEELDFGEKVDEKVLVNKFVNITPLKNVYKNLKNKVFLRGEKKVLFFTEKDNDREKLIDLVSFQDSEEETDSEFGNNQGQLKINNDSDTLIISFNPILITEQNNIDILLTKYHFLSYDLIEGIVNYKRLIIPSQNRISWYFKSRVLTTIYSYVTDSYMSIDCSPNKMAYNLIITGQYSIEEKMKHNRIVANLQKRLKEHSLTLYENVDNCFNEVFDIDFNSIKVFDKVTTKIKFRSNNVLFEKLCQVLSDEIEKNSKLKFIDYAGEL